MLDVIDDKKLNTKQRKELLDLYVHINTKISNMYMAQQISRSSKIDDAILKKLMEFGFRQYNEMREFLNIPKITKEEYYENLDSNRSAA